MFTLGKLDLNRFQNVYIPKRKDLFERIGFRTTPSQGSTDIDNFGEFGATAPDALNKVQALAIGHAIKRRDASESNSAPKE